MSKQNDDQELELFSPAANADLIVRSSVPPASNYQEYRQYLRIDFFYQCAYCSIAEFEASAIRFTIDHYEPKSTHPHLENKYYNLMYCCDQCNTLKGNRTPSDNARTDGYAFFRPDEHIFRDHFELTDIRLIYQSKIGYFTIESLDLNRLSLRRLRQYRKKLDTAHEGIAEGLRGLRGIRIDRLPVNLRAKAARAIEHADNSVQNAQDALDELLRSFAKSDLIDPDPDKLKSRQSRQQNLKGLMASYPGKWRSKQK